MPKTEKFYLAFFSPKKGTTGTKAVAAVRVGKHFCWHDKKLSHIESGMGVPGAPINTLAEAKAMAAALERLPFMDWSLSGAALNKKLANLTTAQMEKLKNVSSRGDKRHRLQVVG